jgi:PKD repeat protein
VCLVSEAGTNCRKEYCDSVIVSCENSCTISARFEWSKDSSDCKKIHFKNVAATVAPNTHFAWKFGDGDGSYDANPTHVYSKPGIYQVCLAVYTNNNCSKYYCDTVMVRCEENCRVKARFEIKRDVTQWNTVYFYNVSTPSANITHAYWSYGDGSSSDDYTGAHKYNAPGLYTVCLKVISTNGCISTYCDSVRINKPDSCALNATFSHYTYAAELLTVKFEALYHGDNTSYYWKFGDDAAATGRIVYHVYNKPGKYTVCLTVKNDQCSVSRCSEINVARQANDSGRVSIYPNPAVNTVSIDVTLDRPELVSIRFIDGNGVARETFKLNGIAGYNKFTLPIQQLSRGIYMVEIKTSIGVWYIRFMKG